MTTRQGSDLDGRRVVIAGGTSGIGEAAAAAFVGLGARVLVTGRDADRLAASTARSGASGLVADAGDPAGRAALADAAGTIDVLVLALSGASGAGPFAELDLGRLRAAFDGKLWPQLEVLQALLGQLNEDAAIVFVTATSARAAMPGTTGLAALNGALESAIGPLATELAPRRVNAISPGVIDTPWWSTMPAEARAATHDGIAATVPAGRVGAAEDVAQAIVFAATNPYMTGVVVPVDGGLILARGT
ncbi:Glucose 1-dehydrogenase [Baekduia alba]|uniref:SDR family oxidoreductase n=1 Tax=Baekduia alba TaxID=2997333 RepID=UPI002341A677|nr:SDR family oxidoreductase [Baekduia alba]WCB91681.1 Glucose 1-dehydrogenase [Baekduia alba]